MKLLMLALKWSKALAPMQMKNHSFQKDLSTTQICDFEVFKSTRRLQVRFSQVYAERHKVPFFASDGSYIYNAYWYFRSFSLFHALHIPSCYLVYQPYQIHCIQSSDSIFIPSLLCAYFCLAYTQAGPAIRRKCMMSVLRLLYSAPASLLSEVLADVPVSSLIAQLLTSPTQNLAMIGIVMSAILMEKLPDIFQVHFRREG